MVILIFCIAGAIIFGLLTKKYDNLATFFLAGCCFAIALIAGISAILININIDGTIAANQQVYNSLTYQLENNFYDNDNDVGKKELMKDIQEWNSDLARGKSLMNNPACNIFYPRRVYESFDFIKLGDINNE